MAEVTLTASAWLDLQSILEHWNQTILDYTIVSRNAEALLRDLERLAATPMLDRKDPALKSNPLLRWCYAKNTDFRAYYERLEPAKIRVIRLWPSKRLPLTPDEVLESEA